MIGEIFFFIFMAEPQLERVEKRQKSQYFKIVQINPALGKINANACANKSLLKVSSQSFDAIVLSKMFLNLSVNAASICDLTKPCKVFKEDFAVEATYQLLMLFTNFKKGETTVFLMN